jgi:AcrR family transcriptional regulator
VLQDYYFSRDNTQDEILRAALEIFATLGYKKTSMSDISDRAGVSRPTIYTYFKNKQAVFLAVTEGIYKSVVAKVQLALERPDSLEAKLTVAFKQWTQPYREIMFGSVFGQELIGAGNSVAATVSENALARFQGLLSDCLKQHQNEGDIDLRKIKQSGPESAQYLILCINGLSMGVATEEVFKRRVSVFTHSFIASIASAKE